MESPYKILLNKLEGFIRRYYTHKILKGFLFFVGGFACFFIVFSILEYVGYFQMHIRKVFFYSFILFNIIILILYILIPLLGLLRLGKRLSFEDAAVLLGKHFKNEINDKILNTLQLRKYLENNEGNTQLLTASIEQKSSRLSSFPFATAIDLKSNLKYVPFTLLLIMLIVGGWFFFPLILKEPAQRILRYDVHYERPAPFEISILNETPMVAYRNERFTIDIQIEGSVFPADVEIELGRNTYLMTRKAKDLFSYEIRNINDPVSFYLLANRFRFGPYKVDVESRAVIKNFVLKAQYPPYTNLNNDVFNNIGDVTVPEGTKLTWNIYTEDTDQLVFQYQDKEIHLEREGRNVFQYDKTLTQQLQYSLKSYGYNKNIGDSLQYKVTIVPDAYPEISVQEYQDSIRQAHLFFQGLIRDDYGFTNLAFNYAVYDSKKSTDQVKFVPVSIPFEKDNLNQNFYFHWDLQSMDIRPGMTFEYYFSVSDNDGINGPKTTHSRMYSISIPTHEELIAETRKSEKAIESGLQESVSSINEIQSEIDQLRRTMLESESISWEQQETLKNLLEKQKEAQEKFEELQKFSEDQNIKEQQFRKPDENILKKQEELERLFDEVMSDELKELYEQIQKELEKLQRDKAFEMLDKLQFEMQDFENRLDRALELFRQLQVERMLSESIESLNRIKEEQKQLSDDLADDKAEDKAAQDQADINESFDSLQEMLEDMMKKNEELSRPNPLDDTSLLQENIQELLEQALEQLNNKDRGGAMDNQQDAMKSMDQLSQMLQNMQSNMMQQNLAEDIRTLREILDNLLKVSFAQEDLMQIFRHTNTRDPQYHDLIQNQRKISQDLTMIQDSLQALAKRQIQIQSFVNREIAEINMNIDEAINHLINRRKASGNSKQQFVMTHVNNLALLLNESMQNMQMQMQAQGEGMDSQDMQGMPGFQDLRQMQEQMNQMLEQLREGHNPMPCESGDSEMSLSEQLARMAAEQEAIRNHLNELTKDLRRDGQNTRELEQMIREMEQTEMDIVTNKISRQTQLRQQRILTRLLEHERAELEREKEERRVGETAKSYDLSNPEEFFEYNRIKNRAIEMLRSMPPGFRPHYKNLVELYFLNVE